MSDGLIRAREERQPLMITSARESKHVMGPNTRSRTRLTTGKRARTHTNPHTQKPGMSLKQGAIVMSLLLSKWMSSSSLLVGLSCLPKILELFLAVVVKGLRAFGIMWSQVLTGDIPPGGYTNCYCLVFLSSIHRERISFYCDGKQFPHSLHFTPHYKRKNEINRCSSQWQTDHKVIAKLWRVRQTTCQPCLAKNGNSHPAYRACATGRPSQACLGPRADFRLPCSPASVLVEDMAALEVLFPLFTAREMRLLFYAWRAFLFHLSYFRYKVEAGKESHPLSWSY